MRRLKQRHRGWNQVSIAALLVLIALTARSAMAQPSPAATSAFDAYVASVEARLTRQHASANTFLAFTSSDPSAEIARLQQGEQIIEQLTPSTGAEVAGSLLHDWRGTAFVRGATAAEFVAFMQDFPAYPQHFSPQVLLARIVSRNGGRLQVSMRIRQKHVITVVMDTDYDITYGSLDARHGYSLSRSTRIAEIASPGTNDEHALPPQEEHGFLWRLNTYWSYEEKDGGLYLQVEAVSLTRSVPHGLGWIIGPYIQSIPRESLAFTLQSVCNGLRQARSQALPTAKPAR